MKFIKAIKRFIPQQVKTRIVRSIDIISIIPSTTQDIIKYLIFSRIFFRQGEHGEAAAIAATYHALEKGLSHSNPRSGFGEIAALDLSERLIRYRERGYNVSSTHYQAGIGVLFSYAQEGHSVNEHSNAKLNTSLGRLIQNQCEGHVGGYKCVNSTTLRDTWAGNFKALAENRCSVRMFEKEKVTREVIAEAVNIARHSPSNCNRQPTHVYVFDEYATVQKILKIQGGARSFADQVKTVLIVTADLRCYASYTERHQPWVDGSMFAMTLVYSFCSLGVGSCFLNMALTSFQHADLRTLTNIHSSDVPIVMIAIGCLPEHVKLAYSHKKTTKEILIFQ